MRGQQNRNDNLGFSLPKKMVEETSLEDIISGVLIFNGIARGLEKISGVASRLLDGGIVAGFVVLSVALGVPLLMPLFVAAGFATSMALKFTLKLIGTPIAFAVVLGLSVFSYFMGKKVKMGVNIGLDWIAHTWGQLKFNLRETVQALGNLTVKGVIQWGKDQWVMTKFYASERWRKTLVKFNVRFPVEEKVVAQSETDKLLDLEPKDKMSEVRERRRLSRIEKLEKWKEYKRQNRLSDFDELRQGVDKVVSENMAENIGFRDRLGAMSVGEEIEPKKPERKDYLSAQTIPMDKFKDALKHLSNRREDNRGKDLKDLQKDPAVSKNDGDPEVFPLKRPQEKMPLGKKAPPLFFEVINAEKHQDPRYRRIQQAEGALARAKEGLEAFKSTKPQKSSPGPKSVGKNAPRMGQ